MRWTTPLPVLAEPLLILRRAPERPGSARARRGGVPTSLAGAAAGDRQAVLGPRLPPPPPLPEA
jgi:hypothetical protein